MCKQYNGSGKGNDLLTLTIPPPAPQEFNIEAPRKESQSASSNEKTKTFLKIVLPYKVAIYKYIPFFSKLANIWLKDVWKMYKQEENEEEI